MNARQAKHVACALAARELEQVLDNPEYLAEVLPRLSGVELVVVARALAALRAELQARAEGGR